MLVLTPGAYLDRTPRRTQLRMLTSGVTRTIPDDCTPQIERLVLGLPTELSETTSALNAALTKEGWWIEGEDPHDPLLEEAVRKLDTLFDWAGGRELPGYDLAVATHARRRRLLRSLGQYPALPETVARRAALMGTEPQKILLLGDDDLLGLTLASIGHAVTIVDADAPLLAFIDAQAARADVTVETHKVDLRLAMPGDWAGAFDVVFTDPMSSKACLSLFVDRALGAVKPGGTVWTCVSTAGARWFDVHRRETRAVLRTHFADFNHYYTPYLTLSPYVSDLYALRRDEMTRPSVAHDEGFYDSGLYDEEHYGYRQASRFVIKDIGDQHTELIHLKATIIEALRYAELEVDDELYHWDEDYHAYLALLAGGQVLSVAINVERKSCELLLAPPDDDLERVLQAALMSVYRGSDASASVRRVRTPFAAELP